MMFFLGPGNGGNPDGFTKTCSQNIIIDSSPAVRNLYKVGTTRVYTGQGDALLPSGSSRCVPPFLPFDSLLFTLLSSRVDMDGHQTKLTAIRRDFECCWFKTVHSSLCSGQWSQHICERWKPVRLLNFGYFCQMFWLSSSKKTTRCKSHRGTRPWRYHLLKRPIWNGRSLYCTILVIFRIRSRWCGGCISWSCAFSRNHCLDS